MERQHPAYGDEAAFADFLERWLVNERNTRDWYRDRLNRRKTDTGGQLAFNILLARFRYHHGREFDRTLLGAQYGTSLSLEFRFEPSPLASSRKHRPTRPSTYGLSSGGEHLVSGGGLTQSVNSCSCTIPRKARHRANAATSHHATCRATLRSPAPAREARMMPRGRSSATA